MFSHFNLFQICSPPWWIHCCRNTSGPPSTVALFNRPGLRTPENKEESNDDGDDGGGGGDGGGDDGGDDDDDGGGDGDDEQLRIPSEK